MESNIKRPDLGEFKHIKTITTDPSNHIFYYEDSKGGWVMLSEKEIAAHEKFINSEEYKEQQRRLFFDDKIK